MHFKICCLEDVDYHALAHARAVLANSRDAVDMVVESLMSAAFMDIAYTRSIALVASSVDDRLAYESPSLSRKFSDRLADEVMVAFMRYWEVLPIFFSCWIYCLKFIIRNMVSDRSRTATRSRR